MRKNIIAILALALMLSACNKSNDKDTTANVTAGRGRADTLNISGPAALPRADQSSVGNGLGIISNDANQGGQFNQMVKDLVSASNDPSSIGGVNLLSPNVLMGPYAYQSVPNGVLLYGQVSLQNGNQLVAGESWIVVEIRDSWYQQGYEAMKIYLPLTGGAIGGTRAQLTFEDNYGSITLDGSIGATTGMNQFTGTINFANKQNVVSGQPAKSGTLGRFTIPTCGLFRCQ